MRNKIILIILISLISTPVWAGNFIKYDPDTGVVVQAWHSVDAVNLGLDKDPYVMRITYDEYKTITKYSVVKGSALTEMSTEEKAALDAKEAAEKQAAEEAEAKVPTLEKLLTVLIDKGLIKLEDVQNASPIEIK
ncbi:MAG: hypothetical protein A4E53_01675 [Pelotomaculum sp. PtaB.Bin104]|jgi:hypothetical protein|nr:MAG: hypothetical protein A4E53_01675 [Pelotomaculum sp. PtaB.Bin104]